MVTRWLTVRAAADYLALSRDQMYRLLQVIPHTNAPGVGVRVDRRDLDAYMAKHRRRSAHDAAESGPVIQKSGKSGKRRRKRRAGTPGACDPGTEVFPGLTREDLRDKSGV